MKELDWEECVDRYIDDECSSEERRALEERAKFEPEIRVAIEWGLRMREGLRGLRASAPEGFDERLQNAIAEQFQREFVPRAATKKERATRSRGRFRSPLFVGASAAAVLAIVCGVGWNLTKSEAPSVEVASVQSDSTPTPIAEPGLSPEFVPARVPSSEGGASDATGDLAARDLFSATVGLIDASCCKGCASGLQRLCAKLDVSFEKFGDDSEYLLKKTSTAQWSQIAEYLESNGTLETSEELRKWQAGEGEPSSEGGALRDVRVTIKKL